MSGEHGSCAFLIGILLLVWAYYYMQTGRQRKDWLMAETAFAFLLVYLHACPRAGPAPGRSSARPTDRSATCNRRPLDGCAWMQAVAEWTRAHPAINAILIWSYFHSVASVYPHYPRAVDSSAIGMRSGNTPSIFTSA